MIKIDDIEIYDVKECAEILHVHPQTVRNYLRQGKLRGQKVGAKDTLSSYPLPSQQRQQGQQ